MKFLTLLILVTSSSVHAHYDAQFYTKRIIKVTKRSSMSRMTVRKKAIAARDIKVNDAKEDCLDVNGSFVLHHTSTRTNGGRRKVAISKAIISCLDK